MALYSDTEDTNLTGFEWLKTKGFTDQDSRLLSEEGLCLGPKWTLELAQKCLNNHELELTTAGRRLLKMMCRTEDTSLAKAQGERTDFGSEVGSLAGSEDSGTVNYQNTQPINTPPSKNMPRDVIEDDVNASQLLKELKDYTGATDNDLNRVCSEKHLNKISQKFSHLEELATSLGLKDIQITEISTKPGASLAFKLKEVLKTWKRNNIAKATYWRLVEVCLDDFRNSVVAEYICRLSKDHVQDGNDNEVSANMLPGQELNELPRSTTCTNCTCYCCSIIISIALVGLITLAAFYFVVPQKKGPPPLEMAAIPQYRTTTKTIPSQMPAYTGKLTGTIITRDDRPKMTQLRSFKLRTGTTIDFVSGIARDYRKVGQLLLKGSNDVDILEMSYHYQAMDVADRILVDWLSGKGKLPVTWGTLIDVLQECGLSILVYDVEGQLLDLHRDRDEL
ncbi:uncharacterized protein LOC135344729 isoform X3 [Halichondria panicea]|uniref:uncharacterized protein LOC135344729 isoform X2 n=1 Tax=Halichondria panicea TaxID=6063 RepID=UPI00312BC447